MGGADSHQNAVVAVTAANCQQESAKQLNDSAQAQMVHSSAAQQPTPTPVQTTQSVMVQQPNRNALQQQ